MKILAVVGTRPEIIKMAPIIREIKKRKLDLIFVHAGQHYDYLLSSQLFNDLKLDEPDYNLGVGSGTHAQQTASAFILIENVISNTKPEVVIAEGDTNTVLATALSSIKIHIPFGHVEAGLRSFDRRMPEEINRTLVDHSSELLFAPTKVSKKNLLRDGIDKSKIFVTGNTIVDAILESIKIVDKRSKILESFDLEKKKYFLVTAHRPENVDNKSSLMQLINALDLLEKEFETTILFPIHPRTKNRIKDYNLENRINKIKKLTMIEPLGYTDFLKLEKEAKLILTDSGGLQEEACILHTPCVTLRENTERPESVTVGANILSGIEPKNILRCAKTMLKKKADWKNPFGDGKSGAKITDIIEKFIKNEL